MIISIWLHPISVAVSSKFKQFLGSACADDIIKCASTITAIDTEAPANTTNKSHVGIWHTFMEKHTKHGKQHRSLSMLYAGGLTGCGDAIKSMEELEVDRSYPLQNHYDRNGGPWLEPGGLEAEGKPKDTWRRYLEEASTYTTWLPRWKAL